MFVVFKTVLPAVNLLIASHHRSKLITWLKVISPVPALPFKLLTIYQLIANIGWYIGPTAEIYQMLVLTNGRSSFPEAQVDGDITEIPLRDLKNKIELDAAFYC